MPVDDRYAEAAERYKPKGATCILFVAEAPPETSDRYFYFEDVQRGDWLWIALMKALYRPEWEQKSTRAQRLRKRYWLAKFQECGFRLIDAVKVPILGGGGRVASIRSRAPELIREIRDIAPKQIVLIKASVHEALFDEFKGAGLPVVNSRTLPFPAASWQNKFDDEFRKLVEAGKLRLCHNSASTGAGAPSPQIGVIIENGLCGGIMEKVHD